MRTKLQQTEIKSNIPAGIIEGTEAFWFNNQKWLIHEGKATKFEDAPVKVQNMIAMAFLNDKKSRDYLKKMGVTAFSKGMDMWYRCVLGALDGTPDFKNGKFTPDAYNSACTDTKCPHRGKFCSLGPALKNFEVATIDALKGGFTIEQTATLLFISPATLKSRLEKIKEKLGARNMASMMARATELGV
jgi:hypothetical protein